MKKTFIILSVFLSICVCFMCCNMAAGFVLAQERRDPIIVSSKSAVLVDKATGTAIFEKEPNKKLPMASMTKVISLGVIFDEIDKGNIGLHQEVLISENAAKTEGSQAFLDAGKLYRVEDLIKSVIISSANDSQVALAEAAFGSEKNFVYKMNEYAKNLNMEDSHFSNCTGLPAADHYSTANDMVKAYKAICDNPIYQKYSNTWIDELIHSNNRKTQLVNTNRLIKYYKGATGGKTGFTNEAGFCLTASARRGQTSLICVVFGEETSQNRFDTVKKLFDFGFDNFESRVIYKKGEFVSKIAVKSAQKPEYNCYIEDDYCKFLNKGDKFDYKTHLELNLLSAPLKTGDKVGAILILDKNNVVIDEVNVVVNEDINKMTIMELISKISNKW